MTETSGDAGGFQGSVAGLGLSDVIQLNASNRFTGCISVRHGADAGRIFFREGRVVHAEQGRTYGQDAFFEIMAWRSGRFDLEPNVSTTRRTIEMSPQHLLMEAHRVIDERRAGIGPRPAPERGARPPAPVPDTSPSALLERLKDVSNVAYAVRVGRDGACIDDRTFEGEALAGRIGYLAMVGDQLGEVFGLGNLQSAVVHGGPRHMLLQAGKGESFGLSIEGAEVGAVEVEVRKLLGPAA